MEKTQQKVYLCSTFQVSTKKGKKNLFIGLIIFIENFLVLLEQEEMVLPPLIFMADPTMNLISELHYKCERREQYSSCSKST